MHTLRCAGKTIHGRMLDDHTLEVKCKRRACGVRPGVIVLHSFDIRTGEITETRKFANPRKEVANDTTEPISAIRVS